MNFWIRCLAMWLTAFKIRHLFNKRKIKEENMQERCVGKIVHTAHLWFTQFWQDWYHFFRLVSLFLTKSHSILMWLLHIYVTVSWNTSGSGMRWPVHLKGSEPALPSSQAAQTNPTEPPRAMSQAQASSIYSEWQESFQGLNGQKPVKVVTSSIIKVILGNFGFLFAGDILLDTF